MYHSSSGSGRHDNLYHYHPYRRSDRGYFLYEFKKEKAPTFDGEMKKSQECRGMVAWYDEFLQVA